MAKVRTIILFLLLFVVPVIYIDAATLSISPTSGTFEVGDRVTVRIVVSSGSPINAVSGVASFPTGLFSVESISKAGSILNFWVAEPNFSQGAGTLQFEGVTLGGFPGGSGTVVTATLRAVKTGSGSISFKSGQVLANDGQGTDVTDSMTGATFSVEQARAVSKPAPKPVVEEEKQQPKPTLESPEIVLTTKYGEKAISGISNYPKSKVLLTFVSVEGVKIFITGDTDENGEFILLVPQTLRRGEYKVSAVVIERDLTNSPSSNEIIVRIGNVFSDIGWGILSLIILLILLLIYLIIRLFEYLKKNKKLRTFVRSEAKEAEDVVLRSFKVLNEEIGDGNSKMSRAEAQYLRDIKKDLKDAESLIIKEIRDVEES
ncbi:MAG: hypothetical protein AB200_01565 [Parcubacteria bacterium C7867-005]|nr:MAG: hypothetical protein AB200_01565 [Parcubacteria bacterium C7867-005]